MSFATPCRSLFDKIRDELPDFVIGLPLDKRLAHGADFSGRPARNAASDLDGSRHQPVSDPLVDRGASEANAGFDRGQSVYGAVFRLLRAVDVCCHTPFR